jgi:hypothetical protein
MPGSLHRLLGPPFGRLSPLLQRATDQQPGALATERKRTAQ